MHALVVPVRVVVQTYCQNCAPGRGDQGPLWDPPPLAASGGWNHTLSQPRSATATAIPPHRQRTSGESTHTIPA